MQQINRLWTLGAAAALALVTAPTVALAAEMEVRETNAFKASIPARWEMQVKEVPDKSGRTGTWVFKSPTRDGKLYVRVGSFRKGPIAAQWNAFVGERLSQSVGKIHPQSYFEKREGGEEMAFGTVYGVSRRIKTAQIYKFGIAVMRDNARKRVAYVALGATARKWPRLAQDFHKILQSLDLK